MSGIENEKTEGAEENTAETSSGIKSGIKSDNKSKNDEATIPSVNEEKEKKEEEEKSEKEDKDKDKEGDKMKSDEKDKEGEKKVKEKEESLSDSSGKSKTDVADATTEDTAQSTNASTVADEPKSAEQQISATKQEDTKKKSVIEGEAKKSTIETKQKSIVDGKKSNIEVKNKSVVEAKKSTVDSKKSGKNKGSRHASNIADNRNQSSEGKRSGSRTSARSTVANDAGDCKIGFIGAGRMTESIIHGLLRDKDEKKKINPKNLFVAARTTKNLDTFKVQGVNVSTRSYDIFGRFDCDIIFLCFHGFVVRNCFKLGGTRPAPFTTNYIPTRRRPIFILSLVGGIPLTDIKVTLLNPETINKYKVEMHRLVLNTSCAYGIGLGALDVEIDSKKCHPLVRDALQTIAKTVEFLSEDQMDAGCALMGNGLAFVYYFISALGDGGFKMGLNKIIATKLATKTLQCAAQSLIESNKNPIDLRDQCTSPSGSAIYGLYVLDKQDCASGIQAAVEAAYRRVKELVDVQPDQLSK